MKLTIEDLFSKLITKELTTSHLEKKVDITVLPVEKLNKKMKDYINKSQGAQFLKDAEYVIGCVEIPEMPQTPAEKEEQKEKNKEERAGSTSDEETAETPAEETPAETTSNEETPAEETPAETTSNEETPAEDNAETSAEEPEKKDDEPEFGNAENSEDNSDASNNAEEPAEEPEDEEDEEKKKEVNESVTVQDLTSKMLVSIKPGKTSIPKKTASSPAKKCEGEKKLPKMEVKKEEIAEAETEATGDVLRGKFQKALTRIFGDQDETNKIELFDVRDAELIPETTNAYFAVITFKDKSAEEQEAEAK